MSDIEDGCETVLLTAAVICIFPRDTIMHLYRSYRLEQGVCVMQEEAETVES
jgi:hypothetical protein